VAETGKPVPLKTTLPRRIEDIFQNFKEDFHWRKVFVSAKRRTERGDILYTICNGIGFGPKFADICKLTNRSFYRFISYLRDRTLRFSKHKIFKPKKGKKVFPPKKSGLKVSIPKHVEEDTSRDHAGRDELFDRINHVKRVVNLPIEEEQAGIRRFKCPKCGPQLGGLPETVWDKDGPRVWRGDLFSNEAISSLKCVNCSRYLLHVKYGPPPEVRQIDALEPVGPISFNFEEVVWAHEAHHRGH